MFQNVVEKKGELAEQNIIYFSLICINLNYL